MERLIAKVPHCAVVEHPDRSSESDGYNTDANDEEDVPVPVLLPIASYSTNNHLYVDVHGMAKSEADGSPSVPHMVITKADADAALNFHKSRGTKPNYITSGIDIFMISVRVSVDFAWSRHSSLCI